VVGNQYKKTGDFMWQFKNSKKNMVQFFMACILAVFASSAVAQSFPNPNRTIKFIVPFPPGSATDTSARYAAKKFTELFNQPVIIDNKPGGNGFIAIQAVLNAPADGYTVFIGSNSPMAVNAAVFKSLPYDPVKDFKPMTMLTRVSNLFIVPESSPFKSVGDVVAKAKESPETLNYCYGSAGYHLMGELFNQTANVKTTGVPYKGASECVNAVLTKSVDFAILDITSAIELAKSGKIKALAISSDKRSPLLPKIPTMMEVGMKDYTTYAWTCAAISVKTPQAETEALAAAFTKIAQLPETKTFFEGLGGEVMKGGPVEMAEFQKSEIDLWKRVANEAKLEKQ
jgi:tripartite-type tricarboxylate transporter receptor subunit TctC